MMDFFKNEEGASTLEISIISVALIAVALLFKKQILEMCSAIADKILG